MTLRFVFLFLCIFHFNTRAIITPEAGTALVKLAQAIQFPKIHDLPIVIYWPDSNVKQVNAYINANAQHLTNGITIDIVSLIEYQTTQEDLLRQANLRHKLTSKQKQSIEYPFEGGSFAFNVLRNRSDGYAKNKKLLFVYLIKDKLNRTGQEAIENAINFCTNSAGSWRNDPNLKLIMEDSLFKNLFQGFSREDFIGLMQSALKSLHSIPHTSRFKNNNPPIVPGADPIKYMGEIKCVYDGKGAIGLTEDKEKYFFIHPDKIKSLTAGDIVEFQPYHKKNLLLHFNGIIQPCLDSIGYPKNDSEGLFVVSFTKKEKVESPAIEGNVENSTEKGACGLLLKNKLTDKIFFLIAPENSKDLKKGDTIKIIDFHENSRALDPYEELKEQDCAFKMAASPSNTMGILVTRYRKVV